MAQRASGIRLSSEAMISRMWMPSSVQPCDLAEVRSSSSLSESVTNRHDSPRFTPSSRNCSASVVLPEPGWPSRRYKRFGTSPPARTSSSPSMPVCTKDMADGVALMIPFRHSFVVVLAGSREPRPKDDMRSKNSSRHDHKKNKQKQKKKKKKHNAHDFHVNSMNYRAGKSAVVRY